jgi:hypothetical protein
MLLRPRKVQVLADGHVYFTNEGKQRPSAEQALKAPFVLAASEPSSEPIPVPAAEDAEETQPRQGGGFFGLFRRLTSRITSLENDVMKTVHSWTLLHVAHSHAMLYKIICRTVHTLILCCAQSVAAAPAPGGGERKRGRD